MSYPNLYGDVQYSPPAPYYPDPSKPTAQYSPHPHLPSPLPQQVMIPEYHQSAVPSPSSYTPSTLSHRPSPAGDDRFVHPDQRWDQHSKYPTPPSAYSNDPHHLPPPQQEHQAYYQPSSASWSPNFPYDPYSTRRGPPTQSIPGAPHAQPSSWGEQASLVDMQPDPDSAVSGSKPRRGLARLVDAPNSNMGNPGYSIKVLMEYAIKGSPRGRLSLQDIYLAIEERYPIFKTSWGANWRNSARHDISMDPRFINVRRGPDEPGKGGLWRFDESAPPKPRKPRKKKERTESFRESPTVTDEGSASSKVRQPRLRDAVPRRHALPDELQQYTIDGGYEPSGSSVAYQQ